MHPISGTYEYKAQFYLRFNQASFVYGVFRTEDLRKKLIHGPIYAWDLVVLLNILRCGDFFVVDEVLFEKFDGGLSSKDVLEQYRRGEFTFWVLILPASSFALWCKRNIGLKFYIKNLNWFILLTLYGWRTILLEIVKNSSFMKNVKNS